MNSLLNHPLELFDIYLPYFKRKCYNTYNERLVHYLITIDFYLQFMVLLKRKGDFAYV